MALYMAVTPDEYELPLCICPTARGLARMLGIDKDNVHYSIRYNGRTKTSSGKWVRIVKVEDDSTEE